MNADCAQVGLQAILGPDWAVSAYFSGFFSPGVGSRVTWGIPIALGHIPSGRVWYYLEEHTEEISPDRMFEIAEEVQGHLARVMAKAAA